MKEKKVYIEDIGEVVFRRSRRSSRLSIKVSIEKGVVVIYPMLVSLNKAKSFVVLKKKWVIKHLESQSQYSANNRTIFTPDTVFKTRSHNLEMHEGEEALSVRIYDGKINVYYPAGTDFHDEEIQSFLRSMIEEAWRKEAKVELPIRVEYLAQKHHLKYTHLGVRNSKKRWGSCSSSNRINLSLHLMRLPDYLIDYVILHELTHTIHKNHGSEFWNYLDNILQGKTKEYRQELRKFLIPVY